MRIRQATHTRIRTVRHTAPPQLSSCHGLSQPPKAEHCWAKVGKVEACVSQLSQPASSTWGLHAGHVGTTPYLLCDASPIPGFFFCFFCPSLSLRHSSSIHSCFLQHRGSLWLVRSIACLHSLTSFQQLDNNSRYPPTIGPPNQNIDVTPA